MHRADCEQQFQQLARGEGKVGQWVRWKDWVTKAQQERVLCSAKAIAHVTGVLCLRGVRLTSSMAAGATYKNR